MNTTLRQVFTKYFRFVSVYTLSVEKVLSCLSNGSFFFYFVTSHALFNIPRCNRRCSTYSTEHPYKWSQVDVVSVCRFSSRVPLDSSFSRRATLGRNSLLNTYQVFYVQEAWISSLTTYRSARLVCRWSTLEAIFRNIVLSLQTLCYVTPFIKPEIFGSLIVPSLDGEQRSTGFYVDRETKNRTYSFFSRYAKKKLRLDLFNIRIVQG